MADILNISPQPPAYREQLSYTFVLLEQIAGIGRISTIATIQPISQEQVRFALILSISILEDLLSPYLDEEYYSDVEKITVQATDHSDRHVVIDELLIARGKLRALMGVMHRCGLLLQEEISDYISNEDGVDDKNELACGDNKE